jgi:hypothetical protein
MAAVVTFTATQGSHRVKQYRMDWTAHTDGAVAAIGTTIPSGYLVQLKVVPGTGNDAPDAAYDLTLLDSDGCDLLGGDGADLSATVGTHLAFNRIWFNGGMVYPTIANAGSGNKGTLVLVVE